MAHPVLKSRSSGGFPMVHRTTLSLVCALALLPGVAAARLIEARIEDRDVVLAAAGGRLSLNVTFEDPSPVPILDDLVGYDLAFGLENAGGGVGGLRFAPPFAERPEGFVFKGPGTTFDVLDETPFGYGIIVSVLDPYAAFVDITADPVNVARVVLEYPGGTPPGEYRLRFRPENSVLVSGPAGPQLLFADFSDVGVVR